MTDLVRIVNRVSGVAARVSAESAARLARDWDAADRVSERREPASAVDAEVVPEGAPSVSASRGAWASYAESLGLEPGDLTKAQIVAAVSDL